MTYHTGLTIKETVMLNDRFRQYKKDNPNGEKTFHDIKGEYFKERHQKDVIQNKKRNEKKWRKIRSLMKKGKITVTT